MPLLVVNHWLVLGSLQWLQQLPLGRCVVGPASGANGADGGTRVTGAGRAARTARTAGATGATRASHHRHTTTGPLAAATAFTLALAGSTGLAGSLRSLARLGGLGRAVRRFAFSPFAAASRRTAGVLVVAGGLARPALWAGVLFRLAVRAAKRAFTEVTGPAAAAAGPDPGSARAVGDYSAYAPRPALNEAALRVSKPVAAATGPAGSTVRKINGIMRHMLFVPAGRCQYLCHDILSSRRKGRLLPLFGSFCAGRLPPRIAPRLGHQFVSSTLPPFIPTTLGPRGSGRKSRRWIQGSLWATGQRKGPRPGVAITNHQSVAQ